MVKEDILKLGVVLFTIVGQITSMIVLVYQTFTNMFGVWFWFSLQASMGWGMLIALMNDTGFIKGQLNEGGKDER